MVQLECSGNLGEASTAFKWPFVSRKLSRPSYRSIQQVRKGKRLAERNGEWKSERDDKMREKENERKEREGSSEGKVKRQGKKIKDQ
jgi:hypothetical protein